MPFSIVELDDGKKVQAQLSFLWEFELFPQQGYREKKPTSIIHGHQRQLLVLRVGIAGHELT